jgi:aspartate/methionine/tyrosine aminotransferase
MRLLKRPPEPTSNPTAHVVSAVHDDMSSALCGHHVVFVVTDAIYMAHGFTTVVQPMTEQVSPDGSCACSA